MICPIFNVQKLKDLSLRGIYGYFKAGKLITVAKKPKTADSTGSRVFKQTVRRSYSSVVTNGPGEANRVPVPQSAEAQGSR